MEHHPTTLTRDESDAVVHERIVPELAERGFGLWAVEVPGVAPFIGFVGLQVPTFEAHFTPCVEIGWRLAFPFWGHGFATEAARAAVAFGFAEARLDGASRRSGRVLCGFGLMRRHQMYGVVVVTATKPRRSRIGRLLTDASTSRKRHSRSTARPTL